MRLKGDSLHSFIIQACLKTRDVRVFVSVVGSHNVDSHLKTSHHDLVVYPPTLLSSQSRWVIGHMQFTNPSQRVLKVLPSFIFP